MNPRLLQSSPDFEMKNTTDSLVSVIIPTFNRAETLRLAVDSCLAQTWPELQIIIVDDGSTDDTESRVTDLLSGQWKDRGITYVRQDNQGAAAARNRGLQETQGSYVQFLDSDDVLFPEKIEVQVSCLNQPAHETAVCCHCYGTMTENQDVTSRIGFLSDDPREMIRFLAGRQVHGMQTNGPIWRKSPVIENGAWCPSLSLGDDLEFSIRMLSRAESCCFVPRTLYSVNRERTDQLSQDFSTSSLVSLKNAFVMIVEQLKDTGLWDPGVQSGFLKNIRTLYIHVVSNGSSELIEELERLIQSWSSEPQSSSLTRALPFLRRGLGRGLFLRLYRFAAGTV
ncbi:MAG: glycosyltransferase family A protein [Proteobacteria bacterium]|nr:glycosyltransferase family A protein [Pseudomonadota bacterium]